MSENRLAVVSIIVSNLESAEQINSILSAFSQYIVGRMGLPYRQKNVSVITVVVDAPMESLNNLTGKIGMLKGVSAKTLTSKI